MNELDKSSILSGCHWTPKIGKLMWCIDSVKLLEEKVETKFVPNSLIPWWWDELTINFLFL